MKNKMMFLTIIILVLLAAMLSLANQMIVLDGEKTMAIETAIEKNNEIIELEEQLAAVEFKNKQLTSSIKIKNDQIAELKDGDKEYQALAWQVENYEKLMMLILEKIDANLEVEGH